MASLLEELKRRNVIRVAVGYFVLAWVVLQITDLVAPALHLPEWTLSFVTFVGIIGFPFAMFFAWVFELTPEGLKRSEDVEPAESITHDTGSNLNKGIIALLGLAVIILLADRFFGLSQYMPSSGAEPVAEVPAGESPAGGLTAETPNAEGPRSIAVLPFVNMSDDREQEYFSDGISEELLNALAQIRELRVAARTSSFAFKGKNQDITTIGEQLKVETVLEGSVRKSGARVRITAQLINVDDGYHLWSQTYDRDLTDIFAVQDEISAAIVEALKVHLTDAPAARAEQKVDINAYNFYLQARHNVRLRTRQSLEFALKQYQQALDIEPRYAAAWAGKALATSLLRDDQYGDISGEEAARLSQGYLDIAFSIDPDIGVGHAAQSLVYMNSGDCDAAIASIERALAVLPTEGVLYVWKSHCLGRLGEYQAGGLAIEEAFAIDPLHRAVRVNWIEHLVDQGRDAEAREMVTPGTREYYDLEWTIGRREGRWADMYRYMEEADRNSSNPGSEREQGITLSLFLGEPERGLKLLSPIWGKYFDAIDQPQKIIQALASRAPQSLNDFQRDILLDALENEQRWAEMVQLVEHLQLESAPHYGDVTQGDSLFSNAVSLTVALHFLGETERSLALAQRLKTYVEQARATGLPFYRYGVELGMLEYFLGNPGAAVETWRKTYTENGLWPIWAFNGNALAEVMADRDDYRALLADLQQKLNAERASLGWPPKALEDI